MTLMQIITGDPVVKIQEQSNTILDVFTKTINDLEAVNQDAEAEVTIRAEIIKKAQAETAILDSVRTKNATIISKINKILE